MIDSDTERKRKLTILENASLLLQKTGLKTTFHKNQKTKDVSGNLQNVSETTEFLASQKKNCQSWVLVSEKNSRGQ